MATPWENPQDGTCAIAHLSDLHFGSPKWEDSWALVKQFLQIRVQPKLILVTGDLVDTPKSSLYERARKELESLNTPYFVCAGNHDRHPKGNTLRRLSKSGLLSRLFGHGAEFDSVFGQNILRPNQAQEFPILLESHNWKIGLLGADSSVDADAFARGYVRETNFLPLQDATRDKDWDLSIFAVHHHLLSVTNLEMARINSRRDLFNLTCMVNCGSLLEALSKAHVDLVLHGHEHEANWAAYTSFAPGAGTVRVVAAGSATGQETVKGCAVSRITFNVLVFSRDHSIGLRRVQYTGSGWETKDEFLLLDAAAIRQSTICRRHVDLKGKINSEITKYAEFTRERNIRVVWVYTNWLPAIEFNQEIVNSTGEPTDVSVSLTTASGHPAEPVAKCVRSATDDHTWTIRFTTPESHRNQPVTVRLRYCWRGGALLTDDQLKTAQNQALGLLRNEGCEFSTIRTPGAVAAAELIVRLPAEFAPTTLEVRVRHKDLNLDHEAKELRKHLRLLEPGLYSLRIAYPRIHCLYVLAWRPITAVSSALPNVKT